MLGAHICSSDETNITCITGHIPSRIYAEVSVMRKQLDNEQRLMEYTEHNGFPLGCTCNLDSN